MIPGAVIKLGGTEYTVPPINLRIDFDFKEQIKTVCKPEGEVDFADYVQAAAAILYALLLRNYPDMTHDAFFDLIELPIIRPLMNGLLQVSGYTARPLAPAVGSGPSLSPEPSLSDASTVPPDGGPTTSSTA